MTKPCSKCREPKPLSDFGKCKAFKDGLTYDCRECHNAARRKWATGNRPAGRLIMGKYLAKHPEFSMWVGAKRRAKKRGTPFAIRRADVLIPKICPVLGTILEKGEGRCSPNSPSLDCIIPELGYVPGNIVVMSHKANTMKSNATLRELEALVSWMRSVPVPAP